MEASIQTALLLPYTDVIERTINDNNLACGVRNDCDEQGLEEGQFEPQAVLEDVCCTYHLVEYCIPRRCPLAWLKSQFVSF